jgi:uncharacterized protein YjbI with pentapeptide repeats
MISILHAAVVALLLAVSASPAHADCTDSAGPEVNWRRCYHDGRDLIGVNLEGAMLRDATFQRSNLSDANLSKVDGYRARFVSTDLPKARFEGARLIEADFTRANLTGASFLDADLRNAKMINAVLRDANADLSGVIWVDGKRRCAENSIGQCN